MKALIKKKFINSFEFLYKLKLFETKKEFADIMEISPQFLSQLLNDSTPVPLDFLSRFILKFPVNPSYFFKEGEPIILEGTEILASKNSEDKKHLEVVGQPVSNQVNTSKTISVGHASTITAKDLSDFEVSEEAPSQVLEKITKAHMQYLDLMEKLLLKKKEA